MAALLPSGVIKTSMRAIKVINDVDDSTIEFDNGTIEKPGFIIGCDGIHGKSRRAVLGEDNPASKPTFFDAYVYRNLVPMPKAEETSGTETAHMSNLYVGPNGWITMYPVDDGRSISLGAVHLTDQG
jgi:salicylate hydroxylase